VALKIIRREASAAAVQAQIAASQGEKPREINPLTGEPFLSPLSRGPDPNYVEPDDGLRIPDNLRRVPRRAVSAE
jgi:hypothetical protein